MTEEVTIRRPRSIPPGIYECPGCQPSRQPGTVLGNPLKVFIDQCAWTYVIYRQLLALGDRNDEDYKLLNDLSGAFFRHVQIVFHEYVMLRMCSITDEPRYEAKPGAVVENLSVDNIIETSGLAAGLVASLKLKVARLREITKPIKLARDRIIAHARKETALRNDKLGKLQDGEYVEFFKLLDDIVNSVHEAAHGGPYSIRVSAADGPVSDLVVGLRIMKGKLDGLE